MTYYGHGSIEIEYKLTNPRALQGISQRLGLIDQIIR